MKLLQRIINQLTEPPHPIGEAHSHIYDSYYGATRGWNGNQTDANTYGTFLFCSCGGWRFYPDSDDRQTMTRKYDEQPSTIQPSRAVER